jgi:hypothetical protein
MKLDLRVPLGLMFLIFGLLLAVYGLASDPAIYARSLGVNVNVWWGLVLFLFGVVVLPVARRSDSEGRRRAAPHDSPPLR